MSLFRTAEEESEPDEEEESNKAREQPRDSGCFESSENLEGGREDPKAEKMDQETEKQEQESEEKEHQTQEVDAVQEQLQELTVDEGPWEELVEGSSFSAFKDCGFYFMRLKDWTNMTVSNKQPNMQLSHLLLFFFFWKAQL